MTFFHLINNTGEVLLSNLPNEYLFYIQECDNESKIIEKCLIDGNRKKHGIISGDLGTAYLISDEEDNLKSSKVFKTILRAHYNFLSQVQRIKKEILQDVLHNLVTINGQSIQELDAFIPPRILMEDLSKQMETLKFNISKNLNNAAQTFLHISKHNAALQAEFAVLRAFYLSEQILKIKNHPIRKVVETVLYNFYPSFNEAHVRVIMSESTKWLQIDYTTFTAAILRLLENAEKYVLPNSEIFIKFIDDKQFSIKIEMMSLKILPEELDQIFQFGFSGSIAIKSKKNGTGVGLTAVKKLLAFNNADLRVTTNQDKTKNQNYKGFEYEYNIFEIILH